MTSTLTRAVDLIEKNSTSAHALASIFDGYPTTIVKSPPGAGKSTLISQITAYLAAETDLRLAIVAPTNLAALSLAAKIAPLLPPGLVAARAYNRLPLPKGVVSLEDIIKKKRRTGTWPRFIPVMTVHKACSLKVPCDLMIAEEAYQTTYGKLAEAADLAEQVLLVGDPGQIGPVTTHDISPFRGMKDAPAARAPEVFERLDARILTLPGTYRLGPQSVEVIAPLYDFTFASFRPERSILGHDETEASRLEDTLGVSDIARIMLAEARSLLGSSTSDGRTITANDICLISARKDLVAALTSSQRPGEAFTIDTADSLQGGQWPIVLALDPLASLNAPSAHALDTGRLCVMTSRHMHHLRWFYPKGWKERLQSSHDIPPQERAKAFLVRSTLTGEE